MRWRPHLAALGKINPPLHGSHWPQGRGFALCLSAPHTLTSRLLPPPAPAKACQQTQQLLCRGTPLHLVCLGAPGPPAQVHQSHPSPPPASGTRSGAACGEAGSYGDQRSIIASISVDVSVGRAIVEMKRYAQSNQHCTWIQFRRRQPRFLFKCHVLERTQTSGSKMILVAVIRYNAFGFTSHTLLAQGTSVAQLPQY